MDSHRRHAGPYTVLHAGPLRWFVADDRTGTVSVPYRSEQEAVIAMHALRVRNTVND